MLFSGGIRANELKTAELVTPSGEKHKAEVITTNARQRAYFAGLTNEPGKYEIRFPEQSKIPPFYYGVGIDQREMDTQALSAADVQWLTAPDHKFLEKAIEPATVKDTLFKLPPTMPKVWPWAAGLLLAFLLLETFLTYRMVRRQTSPSESLGAIGAPPMAQPA
jgi:hypothetical protein